MQEVPGDEAAKRARAKIPTHAIKFAVYFHCLLELLDAYDLIPVHLVNAYPGRLPGSFVTAGGMRVYVRDQVRISCRMQLFCLTRV